MEFTYTITLDDLMRFGEHLYRTSKRARRIKIAWCVFAPLFFAIWAAYYYWESREVDWLLILIAAPAVTSALFLPRIFDRESLKATYRQFIIRPERTDTGLIRLIIEPDAVTEVAAKGETRRRWAELHRIEAANGYLYLFDTPRSAIIVPRHAFADAQVYKDLKGRIYEYAQKRST